MKLYQLPNEILKNITSHLPRKSIAQLCLTCNLTYMVFLPFLYQHIEIGHRTHIKQLQQGIQHNEYLRRIVQRTKRLTLKSRQGGNHHYWIPLVEYLPDIQTLTFRDFLSLPVQRIKPVLVRLPHLTQLNFEYCELTTIGANTTDPDRLGLTELNLIWTDFSSEAIRHLFRLSPDLNRIKLGANHNRKPQANDRAIGQLIEHCPNLVEISISLQQVKEGSICRMIEHYGRQLKSLSIRCESHRTLMGIAEFGRELERLMIRFMNNGGYLDEINQLLMACQDLNQLEMISWPIHDISSIILDQIDKNMSEGLKRNVALDKHDLQEIRRLSV